MTTQNSCSIVRLSNNEFRRLSEFIYSETGIKLSPAKKTMLASRLQKRLRKLQFYSIREYLDFLFSPQGLQNELIHLIDVVTTNKTDFFREPAHFDYLVQAALPEFIYQENGGLRKKLLVWSAGCSTGEEPYTLAMVLSLFAEQNQRFNFSILATDISTQALKIARRAIFPEQRIAPVPSLYKQKYFMRSKDQKRKLVRIVPELRKLVEFKRLNFMERHWGFQESFHIIFCRNVIIYFDRRTQENLINRFYRHLVPGGYLFLGHSETLHGMGAPFVQVHPTTYRKLK